MIWMMTEIPDGLPSPSIDSLGLPRACISIFLCLGLLIPPVWSSMPKDGFFSAETETPKALDPKPEHTHSRSVEGNPSPNLVQQTHTNKSWPQLQHDPQRTGYTQEEIHPPFAYLWKWNEVPFASRTQPVVAKGRLFIGGLDLFKQSRRAKAAFGLVPQDIALYPRLTARENLHYFGRLCGLGGEPLQKRIEKCLQLTGLENRADQRIETFSGGMKRRANLAAGILHEPPLLFLDEPTVGIDAQSRNMILEKLALLRDQGMGMLYTTHYMEEAEYLCSQVAIIDEGRIVDHGSPRQLLERNAECRNLGDLFLRLTGKQLRD